MDLDLEMRLLTFILLMLPVAITFALEQQPAPRNVIYITLDGVRWQDFFNRETFFITLWREYGANAEIYGGELPGRHMETASVPISLPSYQTQMTGNVGPCADNYCGRVLNETFPEQLKSKLRLKKSNIAVFSSWAPIDLACQHVPETIFSNAGNIPVYDPDDFTADEVMKVLNDQQMKDPHPNTNRRDRYTFLQAMHYFEKYQPKFLWISLVNADDAAHAVDLKLYQSMLHFYDEALGQLLLYLKSKNLFEKTLVIITTDHGRGNGDDWVRHGPMYPESKKIWAFVINGQLEKDSVNNTQPFYSTRSIRGTIEKYLY